MDASSPEIFELLTKGEEYINEYNKSPSSGAFASLVIQLMLSNLQLIKDAKVIDFETQDAKIVLIINSPEFPQDKVSAYFLSPIDPA